MKVHLSGIGGIGLSALARFLHREGFKVKGSDLYRTPLVQKLQKEGIEVLVPQRRENIRGDEDLLIYSAAIKPNNPELMRAKELGIKTISRRQALPLVLGGKKVYSVAGAHGKSTTSAILASILKDASAIIGAESKDFGSNMRYKKSETVVFEADESDGSFIDSNPHCAIVTNAEPEHMEFYNHDLNLFWDAYRTFLKRASIRIINAEDPFLSSFDLEAIRLYPSQDIKILDHFLKDDEPFIRFRLKDLGEFEVWGFGEHIAIDASLAILAAMHEVGLDEIRKNIGSYRGIKKRFDIVQKSENFIIVDDYAHHPTEIEVTMASLKEYAKLKKIDEVTIIWQPHKYSRVLDNLKRFQECFGSDLKINLIILPVWSAGESPVSIDFVSLFKKYNPIFADRVKKDGNKIEVLAGKEAITKIDKGLVIGFGAGDITYQLRGLK